MAGAGTTLVEAVHLGRDAIGVGVRAAVRRARGSEPRIRDITRRTGHGEIVQGDARSAASLVDPAVRGLVSLVLTSPPYGPSLHATSTPDRAKAS